MSRNRRPTLHRCLSLLLIATVVTGVMVFQSPKAEAFNDPSIGLVVDSNIGLAFMDILGDIFICAATVGLVCEEEETRSPVGFGVQGRIPFGDSAFSVRPFMVYYSDYSAIWIAAAVAWNIVNNDSFNFYLGLGPGAFAFLDEEITEDKFLFFPDIRTGIEFAPVDMFSINVELYVIGGRLGFNYLF